MAITILDGGMGRELERLGAPFRQPEWSALALMEAPEFVTRAHAAFIAAGADVITSNTYAVVPFHIGAERFAREGARLATLAGELASAAARAANMARPVRVAGSLPPVCGSYRPDLLDETLARPVLATLLAALSPYAGLWLAETLSATAEARLVRELLGNDQRPLWLSFTVNDSAAAGTTTCLRSGESVEQAVEVAAELRAAALLFNCSRPEVMGGALKAAGNRRAALGVGPERLALGVYANAFAEEQRTTPANETLSGIRTELTPARYLEWAQQWASQGASIIGGCCGIGPEHIAALSRIRV